MRNVFSLMLFGALTSLASNANAESMQTAVDSGCDLPVSNLQREVIATGIAHYSVEIQVGPGQYEAIRLHRVVKENSPWHPKALTKSVFASHGDTLGSIPSFMIGPNGGSKASSIAGVLAAANIDFWAIDQRWTLVPVEAIDPNDPSSDDFMATWGLDRQVSDTQIGMAIARAVRGLTGSGFGKMPFFGYSSGGVTGFALAEREATMPSWQRSMKGLVVLDVPYKTDNATFAATICAFADQMDAQIANGVYADTGNGAVIAVGTLAEVDPTGLSPFVPGLSNETVALIFGAATHQFLPYVPHYHLVAGNFDEQGLPTDLLYTDQSVFFDVMQAASPYGALVFSRDARRNICSDTQWDDDLGAITIPILYVGAEGGFGSLGLYSTTLVGSTDVETIILSTTGNPFNDFGHDDVVRSPLAHGLWWNDLIAWLNAH